MSILFDSLATRLCSKPVAKRDWLAEVPEYSRRKAAPRPGSTALLLIDLQEYFRPLAEPLVPRIAPLLERSRSAGRPVLYTRHGHADPEVDGGLLGEWWSDLIVADSPEAEILPELAPRPDEPVIRKNRYSAFHGTDLDERLRALGITDLLIGGVMTNLCCETTARDAFVRDYRVFFLADGTATASDDLHLASLRNLAFGFAYLVNCAAA